MREHCFDLQLTCMGTNTTNGGSKSLGMIDAFQLARSIKSIFQTDSGIHNRHIWQDSGRVFFLTVSIVTQAIASGI